MPVAKARVGSGFQALAQYLRSGREGDSSPDRVAWSTMRNMVAVRLELAAKIMHATAAENVRVEKPVYHVSIAWAEEEQPGRDAMEITADRVLGDLGLEEHQTVIVAHEDTKHPHIHIMVNRVHPETLKAWDNKHDWHRINKTLHYLELQMGWRVVPRRGTPRKDHRYQITLRSGERRQAERTGKPTPSQEIRDRVREPLRSAKTWADAEYRLHQAGLRFERQARGLTVTDGKNSCRLSSVHRGVSMPKLEKRFRVGYLDWRKQRAELRRLARHLEGEDRREGKAASIEKRLEKAALSETRRQDLERRAYTLRQGRKRYGNPVAVYRRIRGFAVRWEQKIVAWVSPTAGKILRTYNRGMDAALRPVERGVDRALERSRGRGRSR